MRIISPSVLAADFRNLEREVEMLESSAAEWLHFDVMDGVFVPNISFGFPVLKAIKSCSQSLVMDVHLMIMNPENYLRKFIDAGADYVTFHIEATDKPMECIQIIRSAGAKVGISIKPATDVEVLRDLLPYIDMVLIMSVEPGFGGQLFMRGALTKTRELKSMIDECGADVLIEMDGGITSKNAREVFDAGVDVIVAGSAVFGAEDPHAAIVEILNS
ncbi:MAG: ribulose-phosphate 3-epimerase [Rikenellaceae bacterium]